VELVVVEEVVGAWICGVREWRGGGGCWLLVFASVTGEAGGHVEPWHHRG